jgi:hypothetical protein
LKQRKTVKRKRKNTEIAKRKTQITKKKKKKAIKQIEPFKFESFGKVLISAFAYSPTFGFK